MQLSSFYLFFMNDITKTTRKNFLKWSGLAFVGGLLFAGKRSLAPKNSESGGNVNASQSLATMSRIRSAQNTVVRESV